MFNKLSTLAIIILVLTSVVLIIFAVSNNTQEPSGSNPISFPSESSSEIKFQQIFEQPVYTFIRDGYVYVSYSDSSYTPVNIRDMNWRNIKISPDGKKLAIIGHEADKKDDIYTYNLQTLELKKATFFQDEQTGIQEFYWITDSVLAFFQDGWLHRLNADSGEVLKIESGIKELKGSAGGNVAMNNNQNRGMIYNLETDNFLEIESNSEIRFATNHNNELILMFSNGTYSAIGTELELIAGIIGDGLCGELIKSGDSVVNYSNSNVVVNSFPATNIRCANSEFFYGQNGRWYTLDNVLIADLNNATYFDKF